MFACGQGEHGHRAQTGKGRLRAKGDHRRQRHTGDFFVSSKAYALLIQVYKFVRQLPTY